MVSLVLAGGGTAGHTSPLIATAEQLEALDPSVQLVAVGTAKGLETTVIPEAGLELALVPAVPLPRQIKPELFTVPFRLGNAVAKARAILKERHADAVIGFGGYAALPVSLAALTAGIPLLLHEQNALPGITNKIAARRAAFVGTTFPDTPLPGAHLIGLPLRRSIATLDRAAERIPARTALGLPAEGRVVLVSGGSLGARSINQAVAGALDSLLAAGVSVLHVLGRNNFTDDHQPIDHDSGAVYRPMAYCDRMDQAYAAADLMLGRSGAGTVQETAAVGLPTIFVPLPHGNGEQARNAEGLVRARGAVLLPDGDCTADRLRELLPELVGSPERLAKMSQAARELVPADAATRLAREALRIAGGES